MKETIKSVTKITLQICFVIGFLGVLYVLLGSCSKKDIELKTIKVCGTEFDTSDYYTDKIEWNKLENDINSICNEYYLED